MVDCTVECLTYLRIKSKLESNSAVFERVNMSVTEHAFFNIWGLDFLEQKSTKSIFDLSQI